MTEEKYDQLIYKAVFALLRAFPYMKKISIEVEREDFRSDTFSATLPSISWKTKASA